MALKLIPPFVKARDQRGIRLLHEDEHRVVDGVFVKPGHRAKILLILFALKQLLNAPLDAVCDLFEPILRIGFCQSSASFQKWA